jgi:glycosyltransferase involved in cell wall biosynthesis
MRIVAYAYACEPDKGSEPGAGWGLARLLAGFAETHVITRANNRDAIEAALPSVVERDQLHFHYVEPSARWTRWKRGQRGVRLYYLLWQRAALEKARALHGERPFDIAWHLTLANAWLGSNLGSLDIPFVLGPVGGGVSPPRPLTRDLGARGIAYEKSRAALQKTGRYLNPNASAAWKKASLILTQNRETSAWFPPSVQGKCRVFQHALLEPSAVSEEPASGSGATVAYVGRLLPWKGVALGIRAVERVPGLRFEIFGDGSDRERLGSLARDSAAADRIRFRGMVPRNEVGEFLKREAGALLFPSLHDDSPLAVAEAAAAGLPVICLDVGGTPNVAGGAALAVDPSGSPDDVVTRLTRVLSSPETWPRTWDRRANLVESRRQPLIELLRSVGLHD